MAETATAPTETLKISDPSSVQRVKRSPGFFARPSWQGWYHHADRTPPRH